jgi:DNA-binding NarL/FixJ family response regulator
VDVAVVDMLMPGMPGVELITRLKSEFPRVAVLVVTMHSDQQYAMRAFRAGASGYLTKDSAGTELTKAIRKVSQGKSHVTASLAEQLISGFHSLTEAPAHSKLSDREYEVFHLIVQGLRPTDIAEKLHVSVKTVSTHKARILEKMQLSSVAALIKYGLENKVFNGLEPETQEEFDEKG